jgi:hypothetical protein
MESFLALLQNNVLDRQRWSTRGGRRLTIITRIEKTRHRVASNGDPAERALRDSVICPACTRGLSDVRLER